MYPMAEFLREKRLRWFGHVQRRDKDDATRKILQMTVDGKRNRGRPKLRWRDLVRDDMAINQMTTEMAEDRGHWHVMIVFLYECTKLNNLIVKCISSPGRPIRGEPNVFNFVMHTIDPETIGNMAKVILHGLKLYT